MCTQLHVTTKKKLKLNNKKKNTIYIKNTIVVKSQERKIINTRCIDSQNVKKSSSPLSREYYRILYIYWILVAVKLPDETEIWIDFIA